MFRTVTDADLRPLTIHPCRLRTHHRESRLCLVWLCKGKGEGDSSPPSIGKQTSWENESFCQVNSEEYAGHLHQSRRHRTDSVHFFGLQERKFASLSRQGPKGCIVNRDGASSCNARIEGSVICRYLPIPCGYWAVSKPTVNDLFTVTDRGGNES